MCLKHIHLFCYTSQLLLHRNLSIWLWMRNLQRIILWGICISMYILYTCIIRLYCFFAVMREIECHAPSIRSHLHFYMNIRYRVKGVKNDWFTKQFRLFALLSIVLGIIDCSIAISITILNALSWESHINLTRIWNLNISF